MGKNSIKQASFLVEEWLWEAFVKDAEQHGYTAESILRSFIRYHVTGER